MKINSRVMIHSTTSSDLDGKIVKITGCIATNPDVSFWIVSFDEPFDDSGSTTKMIISSCLKEI